MAILSVNTPFVDGGTVTSTNLNALVTDAAFVAGSTDGVTTELSSGAIIVRDGGVSVNKLNTSLSGVIELNGTAYVGGDKQGNTRGTTSLDIQSRRTNALVVASGNDSVAVGINNTVSGSSSVGLGRSNSATNGEASAIGISNTTSAYQSVACGFQNNITLASGSSTSRESQFAFGGRNQTEQHGATALGYGVKIGSNSPEQTLEMGNWGYARTNRKDPTTSWGSSLRMHNDGQVAFTMVDGISAPTDGGATDGDEAGGTLPRGMFTIQQNAGEVRLYYNAPNGTISSLSLGTLQQ